MRNDRLARLLQDSYGDRPRNARKVIEKLIKGLAGFKIIKQVLDGNARASENRNSALDSGIDNDQALTHFVMIRRPLLSVANVGGIRHAVLGAAEVQGMNRCVRLNVSLGGSSRKLAHPKLPPPLLGLPEIVLHLLVEPALR